MLYQNNEAISHSSKYFCNADAFNHRIVAKKSFFSIFHANVTSFPQNFDNFSYFVDTLDHKFSIIACSENWLKPRNINLFHMNGYNHEKDIRPVKIGGGVSSFMDNGISYSRRDDIIFNSFFNYVIIEIDKTNLGTPCNTIVLAIYQPPNSDIPLFTAELERFLLKMRSENEYVCVVGDFNLDTFQSQITQTNNNAKLQEFSNLLSGYSYHKLINRPTRVTNTSATLLDNIDTNNNGKLYVRYFVL